MNNVVREDELERPDFIYRQSWYTGPKTHALCDFRNPLIHPGFDVLAIIFKCVNVTELELECFRDISLA
jgi:hypothetical protein